MALGPPVPTTAFEVVYNPTQYMNSITNGQTAERIEALKHLLECITHSDLELITLGSIWLCVTGLLTNDDQQNSMNTEIRVGALNCVLELLKIEQLQRRFFNIWLSFDFLARYKIQNDIDAGLWLKCFYTLTEGGKRIDRVDDRLRVRLIIQLINGILTGSMSRNNEAYQTLKDILTNNCHLRHDELALIMEYIFRHLNRDEDDNNTNTNPNQNLTDKAMKKSFEFLYWLIDCHPLNTTLIHYFIQNIVDLHDKYKFSSALNTELLQLITNHLTKAPWHNISVISVLCGIIVERLETPLNNDIDPLSTLLFVLTQTLIDIRQNRSQNLHQVQLSNDDIIHRKCYLNRIQQLPLCWLTILHQVLLKRQNVNIILINFQQFLIKLRIGDCTCALQLFDMTVWKMMDEIMKICYQYLFIDQKSTSTTRTIYEDCLNIFEDLANKLCCLPYTMVTNLFDIKRLTTITRTTLREQMIKQSIAELLRLIRPNSPEWSTTLKELVECIILNSNEPVTTRIDVLTTVYDKYLWFKMTDQVTNIGQIILDTLENLIHVDLNSLTEDEFVSKHALMKQNAVKSIFEHFLSDHSIDSNLANHAYRILQEIYEQDCIHISTIESIHRPLIELILEQMCKIFEDNINYTRLTSFNHCSLILNFFIKEFSKNYSKLVSCIQTKIRLLIWHLFLNIRIRNSDAVIGMYSTKSDLILYGIYRIDMDSKSSENEYSLDLQGYLTNMVDWLKLESPEVKNVIFGYLYNFLKEQSIVYLSNINMEQLISLLIDMFHNDLSNNSPSSFSLNCLIACTYYKKQIANMNQIIDCFIQSMNCPKSWFIITSIRAFIICLFNLSDEIQSYIPKIILNLSKKIHYDNHLSKFILEFLMHLLFGNYNDTSLIPNIFQILIDSINQYQYQTAHNLLLAHTLLCFYFNQLSSEQRQLFAYFVIRPLQETSVVRDYDSVSIEQRPARLQRTGSLSSLNDDLHNNDIMKRKMTVLDVGTLQINPDDTNNPLKKLNDELKRITINYINDYLYEDLLPKTVLILLPRDVRRHHVNNSWLADEQILYQIKSFYDFNQLNKAKEFLTKSTNDLDDTMKNRYRRYTDGNKQNTRRNRGLQILTTCQDDFDIRPLELDTNRSIFNERNLWISVVARSFTSTKTFLAINLSASPGINHVKTEKLHWFEAVKLSDTSADKSIVMNNLPNYWQQEQNNDSVNGLALNNELQSMIHNIDRKDEEYMLNRHNDNYFPHTVHRVPPEVRKLIESIDNVEPVRVAKIGVIYIHAGQEITEINALSNIQTSQRYKQFMLSMAKLKSIKDLQQENFYCPLLDANNPDNCGQYAYIWQNSIYQVLFHASTLMPNTRPDHEFKKKLIGNDHVIILYNENDYSFDMKIIKSKVCEYVIEVCPQTNASYTRVRLKQRTNTTTTQNPSIIESIPSNDIDYLISDDHVASYVRVLALCLCQQGELEARQRTSSKLPFAIAPWQNRLQHLRTLHTRCSLSYTNRQ